MGLSLSAILAETNRLLLSSDAQTLAILSTSDREDLIRSAVRVYSKQRPYLILQAYTAISDDWYDLPDSYEDGFSSIQSIEYPIENTPPDYISDINYGISLMADGKKLRFISSNPSLDETFWVKYTIRHTFDSAGASNISVSDETALSFLCCSYWCEALATHYASKADPSLPEAQLLQYTTRVEEYTTKAGNWRTKYDKELKDKVSGVYGEVGFLDDPMFDRNNE